MTDQEWDNLLQIKTSGNDRSLSDTYRYPYEPTPYSVLVRLADSGWINKRNRLLDYGCGKGRVEFFLSWQVGCKCIGIDFNPRMVETARSNQEKAAAGSRVRFIETTAETYEVPEDINRIYFFNPFSSEIFHKVMARIRDSWYLKPREIILFFYYPSDEYVAELMSDDLVDFQDEIDCRDLFPGDDTHERILIFSING